MMSAVCLSQLMADKKDVLPWEGVYAIVWGFIVISFRPSLVFFFKGLSATLVGIKL